MKLVTLTLVTLLTFEVSLANPTSPAGRGRGCDADGVPAAAESPANLPSPALSLFSWFKNPLSGPSADQARIDRELSLQSMGDLVPDQAEELSVVQALDSIHDDIEAAGFNHMCRDERPGRPGNLFFSRCLMIILKSNERIDANRALIARLQFLSQGVLLMELSTGIAN